MGRARQYRPSSRRSPAWASINPRTSASTACASRRCAPLRRTSVNGSENAPGRTNGATVEFVMAYLSLHGIHGCLDHIQDTPPNPPSPKFADSSRNRGKMACKTEMAESGRTWRWPGREFSLGQAVKQIAWIPRRTSRNLKVKCAASRGFRQRRIDDKHSRPKQNHTWFDIGIL